MPYSANEASYGCVWKVILVCLAIVFIAALLAWLPSWLASPRVAAPTAVMAPTFLPVPTVVVASPPAIVVTYMPPLGPITVQVVDIAGNKIEPTDQVVVRMSNSPYVDDGKDGITLPFCGLGQLLWAHAPGYETRSTPCNGQALSYSIALEPLQAIDNPGYQWLSAEQDCLPCHANSPASNPDSKASFDEINEWFHSGHATVFDEPYFESMYRGTTVDGKLGVPAMPVIMGNEWVPVPPELNEEYHGPGFKLDFPQQPGTCAYCHAPAAIGAARDSFHLDSLAQNDVRAEGVTCDVCHKVFDVILADNGFPFPDRPGVLSMQLMRPHSGVFLTGPFSNMLRVGPHAPNHRLACVPVFSKSEFCAPCHFGKFGDMVIYNSYGEWRASPYAANPQDEGYRTCQDCHMSHLGDDTPLRPADRQACSSSTAHPQNFSHNVMDVALDPETRKDVPRLIVGAADIDVNFGAQPTGTDALDVSVRVTNRKAGHKFPTDSPLRHLILVVEAKDRLGTPLMQVAGPQIPKWAGPRLDYQQDLQNMGVADYSGQPGTVFANLLVEEATNLSPGMAYWNETKYAFEDNAVGTTSDTRLLPHTPNVTAYSFAMPDAGEVTLTVQLIYRFAFYDLMIQKEWFDRPDIVVATVRCHGSPRDLLRLTELCEPVVP